MPVNFNSAQFLLGAQQLAQLPDDVGTEIAFAGRSNAGKSSALNSLCGRKALARVSRTPGRTQQINVFTLPPRTDQRLIDLPGYGYAKVSPEQKAHWNRLLMQYLSNRNCLGGLVLICDIRRGLTDLDWILINGISQRNANPLALHVVLSKADKLARSNAEKQLLAVHNQLEDQGLGVTLQTFSALQRQGVDDLRGLLEEWFSSAEEAGRAKNAPGPWGKATGTSSASTGGRGSPAQGGEREAPG